MTSTDSSSSTGPSDAPAAVTLAELHVPSPSPPRNDAGVLSDPPLTRYYCDLFSQNTLTIKQIAVVTKLFGTWNVAAAATLSHRSRRFPSAQSHYYAAQDYNYRSGTRWKFPHQALVRSVDRAQLPGRCSLSRSAANPPPPHAPPM